jgi:hypothetical protein
MTRTPRFAWLYGRGRERAVLEVCATRACERVLRTATVTGTRHTFAAPFEPGLYYWRLAALRAEVRESTNSPTWAFVVSDTDGPLTPERILADYDSDGREDTPVFPAFADEDCSSDSRGRAIRWGRPLATAIGDEDGDGYVDARLISRYSYVNCIQGFGHGWLIERGIGGPDGLRRGERLANFWSRDTGAEFIMVTPEDYDADGLADYNFMTVGANYLVIALGRWRDRQLDALPSSRVLHHAGPGGDFDDDLGSELVEHSARFKWSLGVARLVGRDFSLIRPRTCDVLGASIEPDDYIFSVPDTDRNGLIDIEARARFPDGSRRAVTWFGGVGAPNSADCALSPEP